MAETWASRSGDGDDLAGNRATECSAEAKMVGRLKPGSLALMTTAIDVSIPRGTPKGGLGEAAVIRQIGCWVLSPLSVHQLDASPGTLTSLVAQAHKTRCRQYLPSMRLSVRRHCARLLVAHRVGGPRPARLAGLLASSVHMGRIGSPGSPGWPGWPGMRCNMVSRYHWSHCSIIITAERRRDRTGFARPDLEAKSRFASTPATFATLGNYLRYLRYPGRHLSASSTTSRQFQRREPDDSRK